MNADVWLRSGQRLRGTGTVLCARSRRLLDVDVRELVVGDWVGLSYAIEPFPTEPVGLGDFDLSPARGSRKAVRIPTVVDEDLALLLGMYASEGHTTRSNWTVHVTNSVPSVLARCVELWDRCFDVTARVVEFADRCPTVKASSKTVVEVLDELGCGSRASEKRVPRVIMDSPEGVALGFLQGLWLDAYTSTSGMAKWVLCLDSPALLDDLQNVLRRLGVLTGRCSKRNIRYNKTFDEVYAVGQHAQTLVQRVPFLESDKAEAARRLADRSIDSRRNTADVVPLVHGSVLYAEIPKGRGGRGGAGRGSAAQWRGLCDRRTIWPSRGLVQRLGDAGCRLPADVQRVLDERLHFSPVASVQTVRSGVLDMDACGRLAE